VTSRQVAAAPAAALRSRGRAGARGLNAAGIAGCPELRQADAGHPPALLQRPRRPAGRRHRRARRLRPGPQPGQRRDWSAYMPAASRRASRCARHAKTWPSALATRAITTSSGRSGDGRLTVGRPIRRISRDGRDQRLSQYVTTFRKVTDLIADSAWLRDASAQAATLAGWPDLPGSPPGLGISNPHADQVRARQPDRNG
jgi:hypothetical protein